MPNSHWIIQVTSCFLLGSVCCLPLRLCQQKQHNCHTFGFSDLHVPPVWKTRLFLGWLVDAVSACLLLLFRRTGRRSCVRGTTPERRGLWAEPRQQRAAATRASGGSASSPRCLRKATSKYVQDWCVTLFRVLQVCCPLSSRWHQIALRDTVPRLVSSCLLFQTGSRITMLSLRFQFHDLSFSGRTGRIKAVPEAFGWRQEVLLWHSSHRQRVSFVLGNESMESFWTEQSHCSVNVASCSQYRIAVIRLDQLDFQTLDTPNKFPKNWFSREFHSDDVFCFSVFAELVPKKANWSWMFWDRFHTTSRKWENRNLNWVHLMVSWLVCWWFLASLIGKKIPCGKEGSKYFLPI